MWLLLTRTRWGALVRAATQDREMVGALGVDQAKLFTSVFFVGSVLAGLGGALQIPREPANLDLDLAVIADAFVVTVVGGLGSIGGAFLAAILIGVAKAFCIGFGKNVFSKLTLVVEFVIMALVLVMRPFGPLGQAAGRCRALAADPAPPLQRRRRWTRRWSGWRCCWPCRCSADRYVTVLLTDIVCFALFAVSLHFIMGPAGMVSFGHAAYFGLGAYAAGLLLKQAGLPMEPALVLAPLAAGAFAVVYRLVLRAPVGRLSRHADPGLRADQLVDRLPVGRLHRRQQRPVRHLARRPGSPARRPTTTWRSRSAAPASRCCGARCSRRSATRCAPAAIRRCAPRPSASTCARFQWAAFVLAGTLAGLAGARLRLLQGQHLALGRSPSPSRPTGWSWCCWAASRP